jgi:mannose-1-phosphate guanylyltransferase
MMGNNDNRAAIILAGGDGTRLSGLVRSVVGQNVPKQFCSLLGEDTLIGRTRRRVSLAVAPRNTMFVVNQAHEPFYAPILHGVTRSNLVVQPENKGTAPAILLALVRMAAVHPDASVAIFPSDHFISDERQFMRHVENAFEAVHARPELTVLLGIEPSHPDVSCGWIEPAGRIAFEDYSLYRVRGFCEKPGLEQAVDLLKHGGLWNSAVVVARISTLMGMMMVAAPDLHEAFAPLRAKFPEPPSPRNIAAVYRNLFATGFSERVLAKAPVNLAVLPVAGLRWVDLGDPHKLQQTWNKLGLRPSWSIGA